MDLATAGPSRDIRISIPQNIISHQNIIRKSKPPDLLPIKNIRTTPGLSIGHIRAFFCTSKWFLQLQDIHVRSGSQYLRTSSSHHNLIRTPVPLELLPKPLGLLQNSRSVTLGLSLVPLNGPCNCRTFSWYQDLNTSEHHHDIVTSPVHHNLPIKNMMATSGLSIDHIRAFFSTSKWTLRLHENHVTAGPHLLRNTI